MGTTDQIVTFLVSLVGSGALTSALVFLARTLISDRLANSIRHEYDQKLATFRAQIRATEAERNAAQSSFSSSHEAAFARRLEAIQVIWDAMMELRRKTPMVLAVVDQVQGEQFQTLLSSMKDNATILEQVSFETVGKELAPVAAGADSARLFAGEQMSAFFEAYKSIIVIASSLLYVALKEGRGKAWHEGNQVDYLLKAVLNDEELTEFNAQTFKLEWIRNAIERKALVHANDVISGRESGEMAFRHAIEIQTAAQRVQMNAQATAASIK